MRANITINFTNKKHLISQVIRAVQRISELSDSQIAAMDRTGFMRAEQVTKDCVFQVLGGVNRLHLTD